MKNLPLQKGYKILLITAVTMTILACFRSSDFDDLSWWRRNVLRRLEGISSYLSIWARESENRALGENVLKAEPAKPDINAVSGVGEILTEEWVVNVFEGIVTDFKQSPEICNANYFDFPAINCPISYSAEKIVPYQNTLSIPEAGSWIQLDIKPERYSSIGVQFWGDYADGWAIVIVDDVPVWKGYTKFENCEFVNGVRFITEETCKGGFFYYIEVDGLERTPHTLRVVNIGGGETTIGYFGLGKVTR